VLAALHEEADGGAPTGLHAHRADGALMIEQRWVIVAGERR
jgi:hypothetical protein